MILVSNNLTIAQDYIVQTNRFQIVEEFGCSSLVGVNGLELLLMISIPIFFPLATLTLYSRESIQEAGSFN